jgi:hypothetical protein
MPVNHGANTDSRPAVYNEKSTGTSPSDAGPLADLQTNQESQPVLDQQAAGEQASDTHQTAINQANSVQTDTPIRIGRVLLALPYVHCYKIQLSGRQGTCIATATTNHSNMPLGVRAGEVIPPNSTVLVWKPNTGTLAYIIAVLPTPTMHDAFNASDLIQQGGNSGPKKVEAYRNIPKSTRNAHGWVPQSSGRPMDGLIGEYSRMSETGIGLLIDSFQTYLRVNEVCGLWLNYFDSYAKLAGLALTIQSYCEHNFQFYDEGENFGLKGYATYPWEATGMYNSGEKFSVTNEAEQVQLDKEFPFALEDIENHAQTPIYRLTDYTGYLGQGFNRTLMKPARESGRRLLTDNENDTGLFQELLALDGGYTLRSAKQVTLAKYPLIPNPRRRRQIEDARGDDLTENNEYRFSGKFGGGDPHVVRDWDDSEVSELRNLMRPAGVQDLLAHHYNWKSTHPFEYHTGDYEYPEENEGNNLNSVKFHRGRLRRAYVTAGHATSLQIDERYGNVKYYNTASFVSLTEDGSILIADGYGSQITMTGGQIRLEAGGDVMLMSGSRVVTLGKEAIIRANDSVDISSSHKDVRIKAERNLQVLGGNSGSGGVLIESKGKGIRQDYEQKIGEDVAASGIVLLSRSGSVSTLTETIYLRSGVQEGNAEGTGSIIMDCANGRSTLMSYAQSHAFFNSQGLGIWHSPVGQDEINIDKSHFFGPSFAKINGPTVMSKSVVICEGGSLGVDNNIFAKGNIIALKAMACFQAKVGGSETNNIPEDVNNFIDEFCTLAEGVTEFALPFFEAFYTSFAWQEKQPGNTELLNNQIGFSYRDSSSRGGRVYDYDDGQFFLLETRWQQLERVGLVSGGGSTWTEKPVAYQGNELYPWPGKQHWVDRDAFLQYENQGGFLLFDTGGFSKSREDHRKDYEEPKFADWKKNPCNATYKL